MKNCDFCEDATGKNISKINESHLDMLQVIIPNFKVRLIERLESIVNSNIQKEKLFYLTLKNRLPEEFTDSSICKDCDNFLSKIFNFKSNCLELEDNIYNYRTEGLVQINLEKIVGVTEKNPNWKICRTCFEIIEDELFVEIGSNENSLIKSHRETCLSDMNLLLTKDPVICLNCVEILEKYFDFVNYIQNYKKYIIEQTTNFLLSPEIDRENQTSQLLICSEAHKYCQKQNDFAVCTESNRHCEIHNGSAKINKQSELQTRNHNKNAKKTEEQTEQTVSYGSETNKLCQSNMNEICKGESFCDITNNESTSADIVFSNEPIKEDEISIDEHVMENEYEHVLHDYSSYSSPEKKRDTKPYYSDPLVIIISEDSEPDGYNIYNSLTNSLDKNIEEAIQPLSSTTSSSNPTERIKDAQQDCTTSASYLSAKYVGTEKNCSSEGDENQLKDTEIQLPCTNTEKSIENEAVVEGLASTIDSNTDKEKPENSRTTETDDESNYDNDTEEIIFLNDEDTNGMDYQIESVEQNKEVNNNKRKRNNIQLQSTDCSVLEIETEKINEIEKLSSVPNDSLISENEKQKQGEDIPNNSKSLNYENCSIQSANSASGNENQLQGQLVNYRKLRRSRRLNSNASSFSEQDNDSDFNPSYEIESNSDLNYDSNFEPSVTNRNKRRRTAPKYLHCNYCHHKETKKSRLDTHMSACKNRPLTVVELSLFAEITHLREQVKKLEYNHGNVNGNKNNSTSIKMNPILNSLLSETDTDTSSVDSETDTLLKTLVNSEASLQSFKKDTLNSKKITNHDKNYIVKKIISQPTLPDETVSVLKKLLQTKNNKKSRQKQPNKKSATNSKVVLETNLSQKQNNSTWCNQINHQAPSLLNRVIPQTPFNTLNVTQSSTLPALAPAPPFLLPLSAYMPHNATLSGNVTIPPAQAPTYNHAPQSFSTILLPSRSKIEHMLHLLNFSKPPVEFVSYKGFLYNADSLQKLLETTPKISVSTSEATTIDISSDEETPNKTNETTRMKPVSELENSDQTSKVAEVLPSDIVYTNELLDDNSETQTNIDLLDPLALEDIPNKDAVAGCNAVVENSFMKSPVKLNGPRITISSNILINPKELDIIPRSSDVTNLSEANSHSSKMNKTAETGNLQEIDKSSKNTESTEINSVISELEQVLASSDPSETFNKDKSDKVYKVKPKVASQLDSDHPQNDKANKSEVGGIDTSLQTDISEIDQALESESDSDHFIDTDIELHPNNDNENEGDNENSLGHKSGNIVEGPKMSAIAESKIFDNDSDSTAVNISKVSCGNIVPDGARYDQSKSLEANSISLDNKEKDIVIPKTPESQLDKINSDSPQSSKAITESSGSSSRREPISTTAQISVQVSSNQPSTSKANNENICQDSSIQALSFKESTEVCLHPSSSKRKSLPVAKPMIDTPAAPLVLNNHQLNPQELAIFKCSWCLFNTRYFQLIDLHVLTHFEKYWKVDSYSCFACEKSFRKKYPFFVHLQNDHAKFCYKVCFWCVNCALPFQKKEDLKRHMDKCPRKNICVKLFKSNHVLYCMLCSFETTLMEKAKCHTTTCVERKLRVREPEVVIEID